MKIYLVIGLVIYSVILINAQKSCIDSDEWKDYKNKFNITIREDKEQKACEVFKKNMKTLNEKKKQRKDDEELTYTVGVTSVMHVDPNSNDYKGLKIKKENRLSKRQIKDKFIPTKKITEIPKSFNWVDEGFKSEVRQQGECGSCYSFSAAGALEGQYFKCYGKSVSFSEQYFLDCSPKTGGCAGGDPPRVADLASTTGIPLENEYEYLLGDCSEEEWNMNPQPSDCYSPKQCPLTKSHANFKIDTVEFLEEGDEEQLLIALYEVGPILIVVAAENSFMTYTGGIYDARDSNPDNVNHAVLLVGYTPDYYIIKNSWGTGWGEKGYMRLTRKNPYGHKNGPAGILTYSQAVRKNSCDSNPSSTASSKKPTTTTTINKSSTITKSSKLSCYSCFYNGAIDLFNKVSQSVCKTKLCPYPQVCLTSQINGGYKLECSGDSYHFSDFPFEKYPNDKVFTVYDVYYYVCRTNLCNVVKEYNIQDYI